ncbi:ArsR family transcriptional regulator [soil metagenome]
MRWWEHQIGGATRGRVIALLRRGVSTVEELAAALGFTDNAVRAQLATLQQGGVVESAGTRQGSGAGKPATVYRIAESAEPALSAAYAPVLIALLDSLGDRLTPELLDDVLRDAGARLSLAERDRGRSLEARVRSAAELLRALGAEIDVERTPDGFRLRGYACPLSAAVRVQPHACHTIEALVAGVVGATVRECCDRDGGARCRFDVLSRTA